MRKFGVVELHIRKRTMIRHREMTTFHKLSDSSYEFYFLDNGYQGIEGRVTIFTNIEPTEEYFHNLVNLIGDRGSSYIYLCYAKGLNNWHIAKKIADSYRTSKYNGIEIMSHHEINSEGVDQIRMLASSS